MKQQGLWALLFLSFWRRLQVVYKVTEMIENVPSKEYNIVIWFNGA